MKKSRYEAFLEAVEAMVAKHLRGRGESKHRGGRTKVDQTKYRRMRRAKRKAQRKSRRRNRGQKV